MVSESFDIRLTKRMIAVASLATAGNTVADIGTDHAYIPIYLIKKGITPFAIASDINEGPLRRAFKNVRSAGLEERIELRYSDGLGAFKAGEADSLIISGMGGRLMIKILSERPQVAGSFKECILQPQSEAAKVRKFLLKNGFSFIKEDMAYEDGKFYPMMKVLPANAAHKAEIWDEAQICYGKLLLGSKNPVLRLFLEREIKLKQKTIEALGQQGTLTAKKRRAELEEELELARGALRRHYM